MSVHERRRAGLSCGVIALTCTLVLAGLASAEEAPATDAITWSPDMPTAFAQAKADAKPLMICVNARHVEGRTDEEPAAKGLREVVYRDERVAEKSRAFVCVMLTAEGDADDFGELRALGIAGRLVSPQHIFVHSDGLRILLRKEYWSHGQGEAAVQALLDMMDQASKSAGVAPEAPPSPDGGAPEPEAPDGEARAAWIASAVAKVVESVGPERAARIESLVRSDRAGDCIGPLTALMPENKKNSLLLVAIIRGLGRDGLERAALPIAAQLGHKDERVRGNAAVSLEYIGSRDKKVIRALKKFVGKEKDEEIANHGYRALGRCGAGDAKVRTLLLKEAGSAPSEYASYGPCIGLAYFEGDAKAARGVEKLLKKLGVPGSKRGGGQNAVKRSLVSWTLACIGDQKSGPFVREELMSGLEHVRAEWVGGLLAFWESVARVCEGERQLLPGVEDGVRGAVSYVKGMDLGRYGAETRNLMDEYRTGREGAGFTPRGDNVMNIGQR